MKHKTTRYMKKYIFILGIIASSFISIIGFSQNISINTTGAANSSNSMLEVLQPAGAATGTIGLYVLNPGATGTIYGLQSIVNGAATTHYAGYFSATGATNNYSPKVANKCTEFFLWHRVLKKSNNFMIWCHFIETKHTTPFPPTGV